ncbi:hypothetical protein MVEN_00450400 [Mycena venus]|uniref:F-box domain-containing protein n=1 Tax=Mycena venus TaxID=2733690 RepID=A0A8H6YWT7_9AGAR|nr:hypothetical protein MVEN_00450400 [Mycena venus]
MAFTRKSTLISLPFEILREIATSVDSATNKAALCRVSHLFNIITVPVLYRHIDLGSVERTLECFDTLARNPQRHDHVRSLRIMMDREACHGDYVPTDMIFPLEGGLRTLQNLEDLYLRIPDFDDKFLIIFATLVLPNLRRFSTYHTGTYSPILPSFLNHHRDLTHVELIRPWKTVESPPKDLPLLHLPRLRFYCGCSVYAGLLIVFNRCLAGVDIRAAPPETDLEALLYTLGEATSPSIPFSLTFLWDGPQTALFAPLAKYIPQTRSLTTGPFTSSSHRPLSVASVQEMCEVFDQFVNLTSFNFDNVLRVKGEGGGDSQQRHSISADFAALTAWSMHCPTLLKSRLHCRNWSRYSGKWVPLELFVRPNI